MKIKDCDEKFLRELKNMKRVKTIEERHSRSRRNKFTSSTKEEIKKKVIIKKEKSESKNLIKTILKTKKSIRFCIFDLLRIEVFKKKFVKRLK